MDEPYLSLDSLIDETTGTWDMDQLQNLFLPHEIKVIRGILLSKDGNEDRLIWHFTPDKVFYVNSAYKVEKRWKEETIDNKGQSSSEGSK